MKLFNGKIQVLSVTQSSPQSFNIKITFFDGYLHYTMSDIAVNDVVFINSNDIYGNEEIAPYVVSNTSLLGDDIITITADHDLSPLQGEGIICRKELVSFLPTVLDGLSQQLIDYSRNIDLHEYAKSIEEKIENLIEDTSSHIKWHHEPGLTYLSDCNITLSNTDNLYEITVPEKGLVKTICFNLTNIGEVQQTEDIDYYTITVDFDKNQVFTPQEIYPGESIGILPIIMLLSQEERLEEVDTVYPKMIDYHTLSFDFSASIYSPDKSLICKMTF